MWDDRKLHGKTKRAPARTWLPRREGQALVEYALIIALVMIGLVVILSLVGPALGNVFSNQVYNLIGQNGTPFATLDETQFWNYVTAVASYTPINQPFKTFTPIGVNTATPTITTVPPVISLTPTYTLTATTSPTPGPSITPTDQNLSLPYTNDGSNTAIWYMPTINDSSAWSALPWDTSFGPDTTCFTAPTTTPAAAYSGGLLLDFNIPRAGSPSNVDFYAKFTNSAVVFEGRMYNLSLRVGPNDCARITIGGSYTATVQGDGSSPGVWLDQFRIGATPNTVPTPNQAVAAVTVEYWAGNVTDYRQLMFNFNPIADFPSDVPTE